MGLLLLLLLLLLLQLLQQISKPLKDRRVVCWHVSSTRGEGPMATNLLLLVCV